MGKVLNTLIIIIIGPLFAIPRTAATTFELGLLPFLPENFPVKTVFFAVSAVFFLITWLLSQSEGKVLNAIGGVLAPILIVLLFASILLSILRPISTPSAPLLKEGFLLRLFLRLSDHGRHRLPGHERHHRLAPVPEGL